MAKILSHNANSQEIEKYSREVFKHKSSYKPIMSFEHISASNSSKESTIRKKAFAKYA
jgi:hypothetical protein